MKIHKKTKRILSICISALTMVNAVILPLESNLSLPEFKVSAAETEGVAINEENFPDPIFRDYVNANFDTTDDDYLSQEEISAVIEIDVYGLGINDLKGIEYFTMLDKLCCDSNNLTSLDVSRNIALTELDCYYNKLTRIDVSNNTALTLLDCGKNMLTNLDVSKNTALTKLNCDFNDFTYLDLINNTVLIEVNCDDDVFIVKHIIELIDGKFDLNTLSEVLDVSKISHWSNATINDNILTVLNPSSYISYYIPIGYYGTKYKRFNVIPNSCKITENVILPIKKQNYTGEPIEPEIVITCGDYTLIKDKDYSVSYSNNINPGIATATITTLGDFYKGEFTVDFIIREYIESLDIDVITPVVGEKPQNTIIAGDNYTAEISWKPHENPFTFNTIYTANIIVTPADTHCFNQNTTADGFNVKYNSDGTLTLTKEFAATAMAKIISLTPPNNVILTEYENNTDNIFQLLPDNIAIESENGINSLPISWELVGEFNTDSKAENTFAWKADIGELDSNGIDVNGEITVTNTEYAVINDINFPDRIFRNYVNANFDTKKDNILTLKEATAVKKINIAEKNIYDLKGIEYFTSLTTLDCHSNQLTILDLSQNTALSELYCYSNQLINLDLRNNTDLLYLNCSENQLINLNVINSKDLIDLECYSNQLINLNISNNTALKELSCYDNQLMNLDVSNNTELKYLYCYSNKLNTLDVSKNELLSYLNCADNNLLKLNVGENTNLNYLLCYGNELTDLDVSKNTELKYLYCYSNRINVLDTSKNTALISLLCHDNALTSLDLSQNSSLASVICNKNIYGIELIDNVFDITLLPESFDITKASNWQNAIVDGNTLIVLNPTTDITYIYDIGNGSSELFTLKPVSCEITKNMITPIETQYYTGETIEPWVEITCGEYVLVNGKDYTVSYKNNINPGTATFTIEGNGNLFKGKYQGEWQIEEKHITTTTCITTPIITTSCVSSTTTISIPTDSIGWIIPTQVVRPGDEVTLKVFVSGETLSIAGMNGSIDLEAPISLKGISDRSEAYDAAVIYNSSENLVAFARDKEDFNYIAKDNSTVFELTFIVPTNCAEGTYPITWNKTNTLVVDKFGNKVPLTLINGAIIVIAPTTTTNTLITNVTTTTIPSSGEGVIDNDKLQNPEEGDDLPVEAGPIQAVFDYNAMIEIEHRHGNNDIKFSYKVVEKEKLEENEAIKEALKDSDQLFEFDLSDSNGKKVEFSSDNNKGVVTITIPYNKPVSANEVKVFYISPKGEKIDMNGKYDPSTKTITFDTTHFSYYSIVAVYEESITTTTTTPVTTITTTSTTTATTAIITTTTTTAITTLPQTGYSDIYSIIIYGAGILTLLGVATIVLSKRKED